MQYQKLASDATSSIEAYVQQRQLLPHIDILDRYYLKYCKEPGFPRTNMAQRAPALICFVSLYTYEGRPKTTFRFLTYVCVDYPKNDAWKFSALKDRCEIIRSHLSSSSKTPEAREEELAWKGQESVESCKEYCKSNSQSSRRN
jgi:hypothetical protein